VAATAGQPQERDRQQRAGRHGVPARLGAEVAAGEQGRTRERRVQQAFRRVVARDLGGEDAREGEVPAEVQPDRQPQGAGGGVGGGEHEARLDRDGGRAPEARVRVGDVRQAEHHAGQQQRDPRAGAFLDDPEQDAAEQQLLGHGGGGHEADQRHHARHRTQTGDRVAADPRDVGDDGPAHRDTDQQPSTGRADRAAPGQLHERAALGAPHHPRVDDHGEHGGRDADRQREPGVALRGGGALAADQGDRGDGQELR
jgi:hypothetical protein